MFCLPENISAEVFLRDYWQKKPLLIKGGLPEIVGLFEPQDIIELAQQEDVDARLIKTVADDDWQLKTSPLNEADFANLPERWTVLVQNLEQWSLELNQLWARFGFLPQWHRDDIMVSYAPAGGSVGRHYDEYDVFLVQGYGTRRWQLGKWCDASTEFKPNQPIRIFDEMGELCLDEVVEPGDVLYVPARLSHYGLALEDSLTFSFGLRYPNNAELLENFNHILKSRTDLAHHEFFLPQRLSQPLQSSGALDERVLAEMKTNFLTQFAESAQFDALFKQAVAQTVSSRRYEKLESDEENYPEDVLEALMEGEKLVQDSSVKMLYLSDPQQIFVNGEWIDELSESEMALLVQLADHHVLDKSILAQCDDQDLLLNTLCDWLDAGWVLWQSEI